VLRGNIIGVALIAVLCLSTAAQGGEPVADLPPVDAPRQATPAHAPPGIAVAQTTSCASECQAQHDRCRVQTKGSPSCDADRQRCLEICLQKKGQGRHQTPK
jgi:hypothetical protein